MTIDKKTLETIYENIKNKTGYKDESAECLVLGGIIELKFFNTERGSGIDIYKYVPQEDMTDDHDFDDDYLTTVYF